MRPARKGMQGGAGSPRKSLALVGFMASGKSTVGQLVAARDGAPYHDLDEMVEASAGMTVRELFDRYGEEAFRELESRLLPAALEPGAVVSLGGGAPMRDDNWRLIRTRALTIWLDAPLVRLLDRAGGGEDRPLFGGRTEGELQELLRSRLPRYREADHRVDADRPPGLVAEEVWRLWRG